MKFQYKWFANGDIRKVIMCHYIINPPRQNIFRRKRAIIENIQVRSVNNALKRKINKDKVSAQDILKAHGPNYTTQHENLEEVQNMTSLKESMNNHSAHSQSKAFWQAFQKATMVHWNIKKKGKSK